MPQPTDMILPMLVEMREEMRLGLADVKREVAENSKRMTKLEKRFDNLREAVNGESVLGRYAAAQVEDRLDQLERRIAALEGRR